MRGVFAIAPGVGGLAAKSLLKNVPALANVLKTTAKTIDDAVKPLKNTIDGVKIQSKAVYSTVVSNAKKLGGQHVNQLKYALSHPVGAVVTSKTGQKTIRESAKFIDNALRPVEVRTAQTTTSNKVFAGFERGESTGKFTGKADNYIAIKQAEKDAIKGTGKGNSLKLEDFTKEILETKPMNSPIPKKWLDKGGKISIDSEGTWTYTNKSGVSVRYPDGYPDFTPFMHPNVKPVKIEVNSPKNNPKDFENANIEAKLSKDTDPPIFDMRRPPIGYTWHHFQDGETMLLVEKDIHDEFKHIGGQSKVNGKNSK
ncbi:HNH endonuclease [Rummeliibacillus pycnus]|uniref:HNH endonuclease n=1 Tax=Rummeliibacillus pycnus TaxID=101070 RepID=UPI003D2CA0C9